MTASEAEKRLQRKAAVLTSWANTTDVEARMAPAWQARRDRYLKLVDPDEVLPLAERERRADAARRADYAEMARKSAAARRARRTAPSTT